MSINSPFFIHSHKHTFHWNTKLFFSVFKDFFLCVPYSKCECCAKKIRKMALHTFFLSFFRTHTKFSRFFFLFTRRAAFIERNRTLFQLLMHSMSLGINFTSTRKFSIFFNVLLCKHTHGSEWEIKIIKVRRERASKRTSCVDNCFSVSKLMHENGKLWQNFPVCYKKDFQRDMRTRGNRDAIESKHNTTTDEWTMMMMTKGSERWLWGENFCVYTSSITFLMIKAQPCCYCCRLPHQRWNIEHLSWWWYKHTQFEKKKKKKKA